MKGGYSSLCGVQTAIAWDSTKVIDVEVRSKFCSLCSKWLARKKKGKVSADEYNVWVCEHKVKCQASTTVLSPSMETEAAYIIWSRSVAKHNLRYTTYTGDGDSKAFTAVKESKGIRNRRDQERRVCRSRSETCWQEFERSEDTHGIPETLR
eukprot:scpid73374/ scgid22502/ 